MPLTPPPSNEVPPIGMDLAASTQLWRLHLRSRRSSEFENFVPGAHFGGGRFDSTAADPYSYIYVASAARTALLEALTPNIPIDEKGVRFIRRASIAGRVISALELTEDVRLITLVSGVDLGAVGQDAWLVTCASHEYAFTRDWAHWLRSAAPWAQGIRWRSMRDLTSDNIILFGDRCPEGTLRPVPGTTIELDDSEGAKWINEQLAPYRISIQPSVMD